MSLSAEDGTSPKNPVHCVRPTFTIIWLIETTSGSVYRYASGGLGLTQCSSLLNGTSYYGTTCFDIFPTAAEVGDNSFIKTNYLPDNDFNYLFFNRDDNYVTKCLYDI